MHGFRGVVEGWVETVETMLNSEPNPWTGGARKRTAAERRQAYDHKVVARIAPKFVKNLAEADREKAELDAKLKVAEAAEAARAAAEAGVSSGADDDADGGGADAASGPLDPAVAEALLTPEELKKLKKDRTAAGKRVKELEDAFWPLDSGARASAARKSAATRAGADAVAAAAGASGQTVLDVGGSVAAPVGAAGDDTHPVAGLHAARDALIRGDRQGEAVLDILREDLAVKLEGHVVRRRRELIDMYRGVGGEVRGVAAGY